MKIKLKKVAKIIKSLMKLLKKASTIAPGPEPGLTMCLAATYSMHELLARTPRGRRPLDILHKRQTQF